MSSPSDSNSGGVNIRAGRYFIAKAVGTCGYCRASTRLIALALPSEHETLWMDSEAECEAAAQDIWERASGNAFVFFVGYLPDAVQRRLGKISKLYRVAHSAKAAGSYWANHCEQCGSLLDDQDLFCEPGGAFLPVSPESAAEVTLVRVEEGIEAAAAGYAYHPQFFDSMVEEPWPSIS